MLHNSLHKIRLVIAVVAWMQENCWERAARVSTVGCVCACVRVCVCRWFCGRQTVDTWRHRSVCTAADISVNCPVSTCSSFDSTSHRYSTHHHCSTDNALVQSTLPCQ